MAARALDEVARLEEAVNAALKLTDASNTLLVVTADHSHTMTFGGASVPRGNPVLGVFLRPVFLSGVVLPPPIIFLFFSLFSFSVFPPYVAHPPSYYFSFYFFLLVPSFRFPPWHSSSLFFSLLFSFL